MSALSYRPDRRISGAIMVDGEMLAFDATDFNLEEGAQAVVIGARGRIYVDTIVADHPTEMQRRGQNRSALVNYTSGDYPPGTPEKLHVRVLGRYIPRQVAEHSTRGKRMRDKLRALTARPTPTPES